MNYGFIKVGAAVPQVKIADCAYNVAQIRNLMQHACGEGVQILAFPELSVMAYTCGDLLGQQLLLEEAESAMCDLLDSSVGVQMLCIVGLAVRADNQLFNAAVVFQNGKLLGVVPKTYLPNYNEFYEERWFASAWDVVSKTISLCGQEAPFGADLLFRSGDVCVGIEICEDLWVPIPPSSILSLYGANVIINLSATNELINKHNYLLSLISQQSARCRTAYVYASAGIGESSTDLVYAGNGIIAENGTLLARSERFEQAESLTVSEVDIEHLQIDRRKNNSFMGAARELGRSFRTIFFDLAEESFTLTRHVRPLPFVPAGDQLSGRCEEIINIQVSALVQRLRHTQSKTAVIGISGGLDSTLALLISVLAFDRLGLSRKQIIGVTMPGFGTTGRTYNNANDLMRSLDITMREISIKEACIQHFKDIGHDIDIHDVTYENSQARERTQILMDVANQTGGLVIGTGDLSELALGWATYNGDHMSMYGVNCSIPKTLVRYLVEWIARNGIGKQSAATLLDIVDTPISPELIPAGADGEICQKTEDLVGPYELHDFFLYHFLRYGSRPSRIYYLAKIAFKGVYPHETIKKWLNVFFRRFFNQQFKRSCLPDGPKVGSISLSPRGDWRMPSDASSALWLRETESL